MVLTAWLLPKALFVLVMIPACAAGQNAPTSPTSSSSGQSVLAQLVALRDDFVKRIKAEGFEPSLPAPKIILNNEPAYGAYDRGKNTLYVAVWEALEPDQRAQFASLFGQGQTGGRAFDETVHRWVFTHELGHWWQACQQKIGPSHYSQEHGASRVAAAYWRLEDAIFMEMTAKRIAAVRASLQNLVPESQQNERYFNENYERLGPTLGFIWFQCDMVSKVVAEQPSPSFRHTLQEPVYP